MQLDERSPLRAALAAASCGLLGITPQLVLASSDPAKIDSAALYYTEKNRVSVAESSTMITLPLGEEETLTLVPTVDVITGASPNGAIPTNSPQVFGSNTTAANQLPVQYFDDKRFSFSASLQQPLSRTRRHVVGGDVSSETDYLSIGANYSHLWDFDNKLATLTTGLGGSIDTISPSSGVIPQGLAPANQPSANTFFADEGVDDKARVHSATKASGAGGGGSGFERDARSKRVVDGLVGLTRVVNRRTLMQLNYGVGVTNGYLTDPYKIISFVNATTGATSAYVTELRPSNRLRQTIYWETVFHLPEDIVRLSYRHYWDDWHVTAETINLNYHLKLGDSGFYIEPQLRYYTQTAAYFYRYKLEDNVPLPAYASADYRLAAMTSYTYIMKFSIPISKEGEFAVRGMYMLQKGNDHPSDAVGVQRAQDLYPGLEAASVQLSLSFQY